MTINITMFVYSKPLFTSLKKHLILPFAWFSIQHFSFSILLGENPKNGKTEENVISFLLTGDVMQLLLQKFPILLRHIYLLIWNKMSSLF